MLSDVLCLPTSQSVIISFITTYANIPGALDEQIFNNICDEALTQIRPFTLRKE